MVHTQDLTEDVKPEAYYELRYLVKTGLVFTLLQKIGHWNIGTE